MTSNEDFEAFDMWYSANERRFHDAAFTLRDVAYAAGVASREALEEVAEQETLPGMVE